MVLTRDEVEDYLRNARNGGYVTPLGVIRLGELIDAQAAELAELRGRVAALEAAGSNLADWFRIHHPDTAALAQWCAAMAGLPAAEGGSPDADR